MKKVLFSVLVVLMIFGWSGVSAVQIKKETPPSTRGWCCKNGKVVKTLKTACPAKAPFSTDRAAVAKACSVGYKGYCLVKETIAPATKSECESNDGSFFTQRKQAEKALSAQKGWCIDRDDLLQMTRGKCSKRKAFFYADEDKAQKAFGLQKGWCYKKLKLQPSTRQSCLSQKGAFHIEKKPAEQQLKTALAAGKTTERKPSLAKKSLKTAPDMTPASKKPTGMTATAVPSAKKPGGTLKKADVKAQKITPAKAKPTSPALTAQPGAIMAAKKIEGVAAPAAIPKSSGASHGIYVTRPQRGAYHHFGDTIAIKWSFPGGPPSADTCRISLRRDSFSEDEFDIQLYNGAIPASDSEGVHTIAGVRLPAETEIPTGHDYYIHVARNTAASFWGDSRAFSIGLPLDPADLNWRDRGPLAVVLRPAGGEDWHPAGSGNTQGYPIRWKVWPVELPAMDGWHCHFLRAGTELGDNAAVQAPELDWDFNNATREYSARVGIPSHYSDGDYQLYVTTVYTDPETGRHFPIQGQSNTFTIDNNPEVTRGIMLTRPWGDIQVRPGEDVLVRWERDPPDVQWGTPGFRFYISLLNTATWEEIVSEPSGNQAGEEWLTVPQDTPAGEYVAMVRYCDGRENPPAGMECSQFNPQTGIWARSKPFEVLETDSITLIWPPERYATSPTLYPGVTYTIKWKASGHARDKQVRINLTSESGGRFIGLVDAGQEQFEWHPCEYDGQPFQGRWRIVVFTVEENSKAATSVPLIMATPTISVTRPSGGESFRQEDRMLIAWQDFNFPAGAELKVLLYKGGIEFIPLRSQPADHSSDSYVWYVFKPFPTSGGRFGGLPWEEGDDYSIVVQLKDCPGVRGESQRFSITR